ncbi:M-phase inducer phosphatase [Trachipleistophora hominis]|uniref:M-phase inducer phosphatase n=1 Tax=Trachipleistophora hominis TaxID=72359 RepID=L7JUI3_TRAHO|nr:M-phase inducer phosphatase [Trachipleistophora hominis]
MKSVINNNDSCSKRRKYDDCSDSVANYAAGVDENIIESVSENMNGNSCLDKIKGTLPRDNDALEAIEDIIDDSVANNGEAWHDDCTNNSGGKNDRKINFSRCAVVEKFSKNDSHEILMKKPFHSHWTSHMLRSSTIVKQQKKLALKRTFTVPTRRIDVTESSNFIDFWQRIDNGVKYTLPVVSHGKSDSIPRISCSVLHETITGKYNVKYKIIDCRFDYEYNGGHIKDAINIDNVDSLIRSIPSLCNHVLIFHCEFSSVRAPRIAKYLRNYDRFNNEYPSLDFPEIYVLEGGYKEFFHLFKDCCHPQNYVMMSKRK